MRTTHRAARAALTTLALTTALGATVLVGTACSPSKESDSTAGSSSAQSPAPATAPADAAPVELRDGWAKATDSDMTAVFGTLHNAGPAEATLVSADSPVAGTTQLHETVSGDSGMQMREKPGGFVIPAGGDLELTPGGNHVMLMSLTAPITTGTQVQLHLHFADGSSRTVTAPARSFSGAEEHYDHGGGMTGAGAGGGMTGTAGGGMHGAPGGHGH